jgi:agmatinase
MKFDPNAPATEESGIFGLPHKTEDAKVVLIPVPWDVTASATNGSAHGPKAIYHASKQVDLHLQDIPRAWENGIFMEPVSEELLKKNKRLRKLAKEYIGKLLKNSNAANSVDGKLLLNFINLECEQMVNWVKSKSLDLIRNGKLVGLVGGDHSTPLGLIQALAAEHKDFSILHIDAHCDLRQDFEDFKFSLMLPSCTRP